VKNISQVWLMILWLFKPPFLREYRD